jgi:hypothetical protein
MHLYFDADAMAFRTTFRMDGQSKLPRPSPRPTAATRCRRSSSSAPADPAETLRPFLRRFIPLQLFSGKEFIHEPEREIRRAHRHPGDARSRQRRGQHRRHDLGADRQLPQHLRAAARPACWAPRPRSTPSCARRTDSAGTGAKDITGKSITQIVKATGDNKQVIASKCRSDDLDQTNGFTHVALSVTVGTAASLLTPQLLGSNPRYMPASAFNQAGVVQDTHAINLDHAAVWRVRARR